MPDLIKQAAQLAEKKRQEAEQRLSGQTTTQPLQMTVQPGASARTSQAMPARDVLAKIVTLSQTDRAKAEEALTMFSTLRKDPASAYYDPYVGASNQKALSSLSEIMGQDLTGGVSQDWLAQNRQLLNGARYTTTGESPAAPGAKTTAQEDAAYWYYQLLKDEEKTQKAEAEWDALQKEIAYYAKSGKSYSDEEILAKIDWSAYGTLRGMDEAKGLGVPTGLNRGVGYSQDALYGTIWAARNGGGTGSTTQDAVNYAMGVGKKFTPDPVKQAERDPGSAAYNPHKEGNVEDAMRYFGVERFDRATLEQLRPALSDGNPTTQKMYARAMTAVENSETAESQLTALRETVEMELKHSSDPEEILNALRYDDGDPEKGDNSDFSMLWKMDKQRSVGSAVDLGYGVNYRWEDMEQVVRDKARVKQEALEAVQAEEKRIAGERKAEQEQRDAIAVASGRMPEGEAWLKSVQENGYVPLDKPKTLWENVTGFVQDLWYDLVSSPPGASASAKDEPLIQADNKERGEEEEQVAAQSEQNVYDILGKSIAAGADAYSPEEERRFLTFKTAANGHDAEAVSFLGSLWNTVAGTGKTAVFTEYDEKELAYVENLLATQADSMPEMLGYWDSMRKTLVEKREAYANAYADNPTYQETIQALHAEADTKGVTDLLINGLHIHTRLTYEDINTYLVPALSTASPEQLKENGYTDAQIQQVDAMRDSIAGLYDRPVPAIEADGWLQSASKWITETMMGKGSWERAALNEGLDLQTLGSLATNDMFSLMEKSFAGLRKLAASPVRLIAEGTGNAEAYEYLEDKLFNDTIRQENERLQQSRNVLLKYGTPSDMLQYQIQRDLGKAALELGYIGGVAKWSAGMGSSVRASQELSRIMYGLQSAGSSTADISLDEDVSTLQWMGAGMTSGLVTYAVARLGVEDKVIGKIIQSDNPETIQAVLDMGAKKYVSQYGHKALNFVKTMVTGGAGEYLEEGLEQILSDPATDLITGKGLRSPGEYLVEANKAGTMGGIIGMLLAGMSFSAATPLDSESHKKLVELTERADLGRTVTVAEALEMVSLAQADMQNPAIAQTVFEQAADLQVSGLMVDQIAHGALDAVLDSPEVKAAEAAEARYQEASQTALEAAEKKKQAQMAEHDARQALAANPANAELVTTLSTARQNIAAASEAYAKANRAQMEAEKARESANTALDTVQQTAFEGLRKDATLRVVGDGLQAKAAAVEQATDTSLAPETQSQAAAYMRKGAGLNIEQSARAEAQTGKTKAEVRNPAQILRKLSSDLGIGASIGTRKMTPGGESAPKAILGYYENRSKNIAQRYASDYATGMHEIGHAIADAIDMTGTPEMVAQLNKVFRKNYDAGALPKEAFSEFVRVYMEDQDAAMRYAGQDYVRQFEKALRDNDMMKGVQDARAELQGYLLASTADRIGSMVVDKHDPNPDKLSRKERIQEWFRKSTTGMLDWTRPAEDVDMAVRVNGEDAQSLREAALMHNARDTRAANLLTNALTDSHGTIIGESLSDVMAEAGVHGRDFDLFSEYLLVKHSFDRDAQGKPVFGEAFTTDQRTQYVAEVEAAHPEFAKGAEGLHQWWGDFMQAWWVDTGFVSQEAFDGWRAMYPNYVPTMRYIPGKGGSGAGKKYRVMGAKGSDLEIYNPFDSMVDIINNVVKTVSRNNIGVVWDSLYQNSEGLGVFGREITEDTETESVSLAGVKEKLKNLLSDSLSEGDLNTALEALGDVVTQKMKTGNTSEANSIAVMRSDGTQVFYEIYDHALYDTLASAGETAAKTGWEFVGRFTRAMTMLTTGSSPVFGITNAIRDFQKSVTYGSWASNYAIGLPKWIMSFGEVYKESGNYQQYVALGGGGWNRVGAQSKQSSDSYRGDLFQGYDTSSAAKVIKKGGEKLWNAMTLSRLNEIIENTSRYAEYRFGKHDLSTDTGRTEAFRAAQEATVDFARKGNAPAAQALRQLVPFFNANLQGTYQAGRMFTEAERPRLAARFTKTVLNGALMTALAQGMRVKFGGEDDEALYNMLAADIRNGYLIFPNPFDAERRFIRIPVSQDPLAKAVHGATSALLSSGDEPFAQELKLVAGSILEGMNPVGSTIVSPLISIATNTSWHGGTIVSQSLQNLPATQQYDETTADAFVVGGRAVGMSPKHVQYLAEQYTGWIGDVMIPVLSKNRYTGEVGGLSSVLRSFGNRLTIDPAYTNDVSDAFYNDKATLEQVVTVAKKGRQADMLRGDLTEAEKKAAYQDAYDLIHKGGAYADAVERVTELWKEIDDIQTVEGLTQKQKNVLARDVRMKMIQEMLVAEEAMADYEEKYITGRNMVANGLQGGPTLAVPTALETMPEVFTKALDGGEEYMERAKAVWEATGKDAALPHPNEGFTANKKEYVIPDEYVDEWNDVYRAAYEKALRADWGKWDGMMDEERLDALRAAHTKGHGAAKEWWLKYHGDMGIVE